jgi:hypothetical protein
MRVAQQFINRDPGVRKADHTPGLSGLGEPRQGTHLSMLRTTHPRDPEGAFAADSPDYGRCTGLKKGVSPDYRLSSPA